MEYYTYILANFETKTINKWKIIDLIDSSNSNSFLIKHNYRKYRTDFVYINNSVSEQIKHTIIKKINNGEKEDNYIFNMSDLCNDCEVLSDIFIKFPEQFKFGSQSFYVYCCKNKIDVNFLNKNNFIKHNFIDTTIYSSDEFSEEESIKQFLDEMSIFSTKFKKNLNMLEQVPIKKTVVDLPSNMVESFNANYSVLSDYNMLSDDNYSLDLMPVYLLFNKLYKKIIIIDNILGDTLLNQCSFATMDEIFNISVISLMLNQENIKMLKIYADDSYDDLDSVKQMLDDFKKHKYISKEFVKSIIRKNYTLNDDKQTKIKFTTFYDQIESYISKEYEALNDDNKIKLKYELPFILKDLELNKIRCSDGMYWYGIVELKIPNMPSSYIQDLPVSQATIMPQVYTPLIID